MIGSDIQAYLQEFARRLRGDESRASLLERQAIALRQGIRDLYSDGLGGNNMCLTGITVNWLGGRSATIPLPGVSWKAVGHTTGIDYGTFTSASVDLLIDPADAQLDFSLTGYRWNNSFAQTFTFTRCGSSALNAINLAAAAGVGFRFLYNYGYPVATTLRLEDSVLGDRDITYADPGIWFQGFTDAAWGASATVTTVAGTTCASDTVPITYSTNERNPPTFSFFMFWKCVNASFTPCPNVAGPSGLGHQLASSYTENSAPSETTKLDVTFNVAAGSPILPYGDGPATVRIYEP